MCFLPSDQYNPLGLASRGWTAVQPSVETGVDEAHQIHIHFLVVRDCVNAWFTALAYGFVTPRKYPGYNLYNEVANLIYAVLHDISVYKDDAYDIVKSWQPLVIATVLKDLEGNPSFYNSLKDVEEKFSHSLLIRIATRRQTVSIGVHIALELNGLTKCFGHPEVVMAESVATWIAKGLEVAEELGVLLYFTPATSIKMNSSTICSI